MRVIERRDSTGLLFETWAVAIGKLLDGDQPIESRIACLPDLTHATGAKRGHKFVWAESVTGREQHEDKCSSLAGDDPEVLGHLPHV
jgi:hypothetical protein